MWLQTVLLFGGSTVVHCYWRRIAHIPINMLQALQNGTYKTSPVQSSPVQVLSRALYVYGSEKFIVQRFIQRTWVMCLSQLPTQSSNTPLLESPKTEPIWEEHLATMYTPSMFSGFSSCAHGIIRVNKHLWGQVITSFLLLSFIIMTAWSHNTVPSCSIRGSFSF